MKKTSEYMATITLSYDARNKIARSIVKMMEDSGLFILLKEDEPSESSLKALEEFWKEKGYVAKDAADAIRWLKS